MTHCLFERSMQLPMHTQPSYQPLTVQSEHFGESSSTCMPTALATLGYGTNEQ